MTVTAMVASNGSNPLFVGSASANRLATDATARYTSMTDTAWLADRWTAERIRNRIPKSHGLSEADSATLPKAQQDAILREIADVVKKAMKASKTGRSKADIVV